MNQSLELSYLEQVFSGRSSLNSSRWLLAGDINGPLIAAFVGMEFVLAVPTNIFIVVHTVLNGRKSLKKTSTFLLFILALVNLLMSVLYMPFYIASSGAGVWLFGCTDHTRSILCQIHGFIFVYLMVASIHILAVISIDRFLSIVKPHIHKKYMTWKVSLGIMAILWVIDILVSSAPYYNPILGEYGWSRRVGGCSPLFAGHRLYVLLQALHSLIPLSIIGVTSVWTFIFTHGFLKKHLRSQKTILNTASFEERKHIYSIQTMNLIGIFGSLLLFNFLSWIPFLAISAVGLGIGFWKIPNAIYASGYILFLFSNVSNPIVQTYFRKDLIDSLKRAICKWKVTEEASPGVLCINCHRNNHSNSETSDANKSGEQLEVRCSRVKAVLSSIEFNSVETVLDDSNEDSSPEIERTWKKAEKLSPENRICTEANGDNKDIMLMTSVIISDAKTDVSTNNITK